MHRPRFLFLVALVLAPRATCAQGNPLGPEFRVNTYTSGSQNGPSVAAESSGGFVVVWSSADGSGSGVFGQRYHASGSPLGPEFRVNTFTPNSQTGQSVASDPSGNFVVIWQSQGQDGSVEGIFGQRYAASGSPLGPEFPVNTYTTNDQLSPSIASDPLGNFVVVWESRTQDGSGLGVYGQRYASTGVPLGTEFRVNTDTTSYQFHPSVSLDGGGNFVVAWADSAGGRELFGQRYASSGVPLGAQFQVNTYTTWYQQAPDVAADSSGNFVVVWHRSYFGGEVVGQRYASSGAPLGTEFEVSQDPGYHFNPSVATDPACEFIVVWQSLGQDGSGDGVFGQRYASSGSPIGLLFRVNKYTTNNQDHPDVGVGASGNFVVVWESQGQDGESEGVFGQRYRPIVPVELMQFRVE
jgi:hypothetical protein